MNARVIILIIGLILVFSSIAVVLLLGPDLFAKSEPVSGVGLVVKISAGDGFWGILSEDGGNYRPINLDPEFTRDGILVEFQGMTVIRPRDGINWGQAVTITHMKEWLIEEEVELTD